MQFSPRSVFVSFRSKYPPQHCSQNPLNYHIDHKTDESPILETLESEIEE